MRLPRIKTLDWQTDYHLCSRIVGPVDWYPLHAPEVQQEYQRILFKYVDLYFCRLWAWSLMGDHTHTGVRFDPYRKLSQRRLVSIAKRFYPRPIDRPKTRREWRRFNRRLFDVSELVRNINGDFATWFNRRFNRRGALFAGRFKSLLITDRKALIDVMLYIDLNPVRAGLVNRPEDWEVGSVRARLKGDDGALIPLEEILLGTPAADCSDEYRWRLYWRGAIPSKQGQASIPPGVIEAEMERGLRAGVYLEQHQELTRGVVIGPKAIVLGWLEELRQRRIYRRLHQPVPISAGSWKVLRPHRSRSRALREIDLGFG